jgi:DNA-binding transcriptional ArsR family regulator
VEEDRISLPKPKRTPLPVPEVFGEWLDDQFSWGKTRRVLMLEGYGENWKRPKIDIVIATACHADINTVQLKTFHRILLLKAIASEYSVEPVVYVMALRDIARGVDRGRIRERVSETLKFLTEVFQPLGIQVSTIVDRAKIQKDVQSFLSIFDFNRSLENILKQMETPEKLSGTEVFGTKRTPLTTLEKELLRIYLFERKMFEKEAKEFPYISWGLESLSELNVSYNIYDESNAGAAILRKLVSIENDREYPGTIVLPDPLTISGENMRYQVQQRDLNPSETLFVSDSYADIKRKIVDRERVSNNFLDYMVKGIVVPFFQSKKREAGSANNLSMKTEANYRAKRQHVMKLYWEFIKPYYDSIERITGFHEGLFVQDEFTEQVFDKLGSKRNRLILQKIASHYERFRNGITVEQLSKQMGMEEKQKRSLYRNLNDLADGGLVMVVQEGKKLKKYYVFGKKSVIQIRWHLTQND